MRRAFVLFIFALVSAIAGWGVPPATAAPAGGGGVGFSKSEGERVMPNGGAAAPASAADEVPVRVYFLAGEQFRSVQRSSTRGAGIVRDTIAALLRGPSLTERTKLKLDTAIPEEVRLVAAVLRAPGIADLEFNRLFFVRRYTVRSDAEAARELQARIAQVVYTVTNLTGVQTVKISAPGNATLTLDRSDFKEPENPRAPKLQKAKGPSPRDPRAVQQALVSLRYLPSSAVTGQFDYRTQQAVLAFQSWEGLGRDGIVGPITAGRLATATAPSPRSRAGGRRAELHRGRGVALLMLNGRLFRAIHTSTGKGGDSGEVGTPPGRFTVTRKERNSWSVPFQVNLPYAVYFNQGIAFHGYDSVPSFPASHGCARLPQQEAPVVYAFLQVGDRVDVY